MTALALGILGSGKGSNCRAILEQIRAGNLNAEVRLVVSDVLEAGTLDIARAFEVPNAYQPPGKDRTKLEPLVEQDLVK
jgi:phosphoribosylglycinamide formyltransferase-1